MLWQRRAQRWWSWFVAWIFFITLLPPTGIQADPQQPPVTEPPPAPPPPRSGSFLTACSTAS
ncbi:MAG: hypothetical protein KatS3mg056_3321 [Chloroflexus sp.]|nr:MAG: hypothetical protein KatS3mg056_3321 [Chloroflexus sp.]